MEKLTKEQQEVVDNAISKRVNEIKNQAKENEDKLKADLLKLQEEKENQTAELSATVQALKEQFEQQTLQADEEKRLAKDKASQLIKSQLSRGLREKFDQKQADLFEKTIYLQVNDPSDQEEVGRVMNEVIAPFIGMARPMKTINNELSKIQKPVVAGLIDDNDFDYLIDGVKVNKKLYDEQFETHGKRYKFEMRAKL